jgi:pheromone shutdown protein TraB
MAEPKKLEDHHDEHAEHHHLVLSKATIHIVGTSHIAEASAKHIRETAEKMQPDIIAIELDANRLQALKEKAAGKKDERLPLSMIKQIGVTGYMFAVLGRALQKRLGGMVKVEPGVDMLEGVKIAEEKNLKLTLVDQDIQITLRRLSQEFTFKEKMRILWDVISAPFSKKKYAFDIKKVPDDKMIEFLLGLMKKRYPNLHKVLVEERNIVMARNLDALVRKNPGRKILLVIGAGHEDDLRARLRHLEHLATIQ